MFIAKELFSAALMIEIPWYMDRMDFEPDEGKLDIWIDYTLGSEFFFEDKELWIDGRFKSYDRVDKV
jgi:hypothetical protein